VRVRINRSCRVQSPRFYVHQWFDRVLGERVSSGIWGESMSERNYRNVIGLALAALVLFCSGCANTESFRGFAVGPPSDFYCTVDNRSPFPPYCHPDHW
jgi:hypothetical protein